MKLYAGKIRDGKPGSLTEETYEVHFDVDKKYAYLIIQFLVYFQLY
jgi:hypothetical protein